MALTLNSFGEESFFAGLEYESSVALESFNELEIAKAFEVEKICKEIKRVGMSKSMYLALEEYVPGITGDLDYRKLTIHPSSVNKTLALEAVQQSSFFSKFATGGGVANFFISFFDWLIGKLTGHGSLGVAGRLQEAWVKGKKKLNTVHTREKEITDLIIKYKTDLVFTQQIRKVGAHFANGNDEAMANDIITAMIDAANRADATAVIGLISLAKLCITMTAPVSDYRLVADRMMKHRNLSSNSAQTCGLAASRSGFPASILIGSEIELKGSLGSEINKLSKQYITMAKELARMPMNDGGLEQWLKSCQAEVETFDSVLNNSRGVSALVNRWTSDASFAERINVLQTGVIGFWYDTQAALQGINVLNPDKYVDQLRNAFEMNRDNTLMTFAKSLEETVSNLQSSVDIISKVNQARLEQMVGNYNNKSARLRNLIKTYRKDATTLLRVAKILESYIEGNIRGFKTIRPFASIYEQSATRLLKISI